MSNNKVLVLALDGVEHSLVRRWAEEGRLPNIQALFRRGSAATVTNPPGISGATWPTLHTGVNAGKHGYYYFSQLEPGTYRTRTLSRSDVHGTPFWCTLSEAGKRVAVFDVPKSHPPKHLNGFLIADWGNHDGDIFEGCKTWPPELGRKLNRRFGPDPLKNRSFGIRGPQDCRSFINTLKANIRRKVRQ